SNCTPYDIMRSGSDKDGDLTFMPFNVQILRAAMGIAPDGTLKEAVRQYRKTFNLADSSTGIREDPPPTDEETVLAPGLAAATEDHFWSGDPEPETLDLGEVAADGPAGASRAVTIRVYNGGNVPLHVSALSLTKGNA